MRHKKKLLQNTNSELTGYGLALIVFFAFGSSFLIMSSKSLLDSLASGAATLSGGTTTLFFRSYGDTVLKTEGMTSIDVNIFTKVPINALGATISFPREAIDIIGISKEKSFFDLWTEDTKISENDGEIHFSGGTTKLGGIMGTGTVLTIVVRAKVPGKIEFKFDDVEVFPDDGTGTKITTIAKPIFFTIEREEVATSAGGGSTSSGGSGASIISSSRESAAPSPDLNNDGKVNLVDLSILTIKLLGGYDSRYDFNLNGTLGLDDVSILMSRL